MNLLKNIYIITSLLICFGLIFLIIKMRSSKSQYANSVVRPIFIGIFAVIAYSLFLLSLNINKALFFDGLFFIGTDWLALLMLWFAFDYTKIKFNRIFKIFLITGCSIDSISLLLNNITNHSFNLYLKTMNNGFSYWAANFTFIHYCHLLFCYLMVGLTFILFWDRFLTESTLYKNKYITIIICYAIVIISNFVCYTLNTPIDFSVILYPLLAGFISYYSIYTFPKELIYNTLEGINESVSDAILFYDIEGRLIYANKTALSLLKEKNISSKHEAEIFYAKWSSVANQKFNQSFDLQENERKYVVEQQDLFFENIKVGKYIKLYDKTEQLNQIQKEHYSATHDELTGVLNRIGFFEYIDKIKRKPDEKWLMISSNIKDFKLINELFGESVGDKVLLNLVNMIKNSLSPTSFYGRIADDKFAIFILKQNFNEKLFLQSIEKIQRITQSAIYKLHVYVGIYEACRLDERAQIMYDKTQIAIDAIKNDYQKVFSYYDSELMDKLLIEKNIISSFESSLINNEFKMFLQPQFNNKNEILGAEALVRWQNPERGLIFPNVFIPVLERTGLIYKLDSYIWEQAVKKLKEWETTCFSNLYISVNVSAKDFYYIDIYETFISLVEKYKINPKKLKIEITETVLMADLNKTMKLFSNLKNYGFDIEIDDFGSGYSSLNTLKDIKADILKIDMIFLRSTENKERSRIILDSIICMAKELNMEVITEGVETEDQMKMLEKLGCFEYQGYYFSKPIPILDFENKYKTN